MFQRFSFLNVHNCFVSIDGANIALAPHSNLLSFVTCPALYFRKVGLFSCLFFFCIHHHFFKKKIEIRSVFVVVVAYIIRRKEYNIYIFLIPILI